MSNPFKTGDRVVLKPYSGTGLDESRDYRVQAVEGQHLRLEKVEKLVHWARVVVPVKVEVKKPEPGFQWDSEQKNWVKDPLAAGLNGTELPSDWQSVPTDKWKPTTLASTVEKDPSGKDPHAPGAKLDAGKVRPSLVIEGMARAIWAVAEVATFGAAKYTPGGWVLVANGEERYADAGYRHVLKRAQGELNDPDSELLHLAHEAWNALAKLDLYKRNQEKAKNE